VIGLTGKNAKARKNLKPQTADPKRDVAFGGVLASFYK
jgi:hypothetical protein